MNERMNKRMNDPPMAHHPHRTVIKIEPACGPKSILPTLKHRMALTGGSQRQKGNTKNYAFLLFIFYYKIHGCSQKKFGKRRGKY